MSALVEVVLGLVDVLEAEGRALRAGLARLVSALLLLAVAGAVLLCAAMVLLWAAYLWLSGVVAPAPAALLVGLLALLLAGGMWWRAREMVR